MRGSRFYVKPCIKFETDKTNWLISLIPTIMFQPSKYRYANSWIIDIYWLIFHITIGEWKPKEMWRK